MTLIEKCIFDYNLVFETCTENFKDNPTGNAFKLAVCTQLYDSLLPGGTLLPKLTDSQCSKLLLLDNIFDYFYQLWIAKDEKFKPYIEESFLAVANNLT